MTSLAHCWFGPVEEHTSTTEHQDDSGRALIEVIFLAVLLLIPVVYILISVLRLQATTFAVTQAARDAGRAIDSAPNIEDGISRARQIAEIDLTDQNIPTDQLTLKFVQAGSDCGAATSISPTLESGAVYDICVTAVVHLPGVPSILTGSNNTITGVYTVHIGDLRESR